MVLIEYIFAISRIYEQFLEFIRRLYFPSIRAMEVRVFSITPVLRNVEIQAQDWARKLVRTLGA